MPKSAKQSVGALVQELLSNQAVLREELRQMREKMLDMEAERTTARAALDLSRAVQMERAKMTAFWRDADRGPKATIVVSEPLRLTIEGREIFLQAGKNVVPKAILPILETRLADIAMAQERLNKLQAGENLPPTDYVDTLLRGH